MNACLQATELHCALVAMALSTALVGCSSESPDAIGKSESHDTDRVEAVRSAVGTPGFQPIAPCLKESDYVSRAVVSFWDGHYSPRCLRLASGGTVIFQGFFAQHPLVPRALGTIPSQIQPTSDYGQVEFEFPDHGIFPYQDAAHPEEIGVIWPNYY
jgi:hypothetical protein